jgi:hypothetical protein
MFQAYIIAIDESTDVKNTASAWSIYLCLLLKCNCCINCDICCKLDKILEKHELLLNELVCLATEIFMQWLISRMLLWENNDTFSSKIHNIHCITEQEVLCGQILKLNHVLK